MLKNADLFISDSLTSSDLVLNSVNTDSRKVKQNDVFVCIKGFQFDGNIFAGKAVESGAVLLVTEHPVGINISQIIVSDSRKAAAIITSYFFDDPTSKFKLIGITGTNGKTTVGYLTEQILRNQGKRVGLIGTLGYIVNGKEFDSVLTTPDIIELNKIFCEMAEEKVEFVIMEVSSHSCALDRIFGLKFDAGIFTNLSQDHLDFHESFTDYKEAKYKFLKAVRHSNGISIFNVDDPVGNEFYNNIQTAKFSISDVSGDYVYKQTKSDLDETTFTICYKKKTSEFKTNLFGKFNIFNLTAAFAVSSELGCLPNTEVIERSKPVKGRLQRVENERNIGIFIDFAHTPDALENLLSSVSAEKKGRLFCVLGAGGDRDKSKRPLMLKVSLKFADLSLVTTDNPRFEEPEDIIRAIIAEEDPFDNFWIYQDRKKAIETAISMARENDIVIIAGKGHETYQDIKGTKYPFDEAEIIQSALKKVSSKKDELSLPIDDLMLEKLFNFRFKINFKPTRFVSTDSRSIRENSLFFALKGGNYNGHNYVDEVLKIKGCRAVVNSDFPDTNENLIRVNDTVEAYGLLAKKYLSVFSVTKIAITGSVGKTTTKEILFNIVSQKFKTLKTFGNENNLIGLPKTIFRISFEHKFAILELGTNQFGEIAKLANICNPDIGAITSIGASHLEFLKDTDGVFREKTDLFTKDLKVKIFPGDDKKFLNIQGVSFGKEADNNYIISGISQLDEKVVFKVNGTEYSLNSMYRIFAQNALIAIAICKERGFSDEDIATGLNIKPELHHRMEIEEKNNKTLLIDCYNANPDSMKAAIDFWKNHKPNKPHIAILGDMLELGESSKKYHKEIGKKLKDHQNVFSVGKDSILFGAKKHFRNVYEFCSDIPSIPKNAVILIKASHSIKLEKILGRI